MNARGVWWDLAINAPFENGGRENSSRKGAEACCWDDPGAKVAASVLGCTINEPQTGPCWGWVAEVAFPLAAVSLNNSNVSLPPKEGTYWRINFSRVEWKVRVEGDHYRLDGPANCTWPSPHGCGLDNYGDNWVWAPTGAVSDWSLPSVRPRTARGNSRNSPPASRIRLFRLPLRLFRLLPSSCTVATAVTHVSTAARPSELCIGMVDIHQPEFWGYLQFSSARPNTTAAVRDPSWVLRAVAMQLYYAQIRARGCEETPTRGCTGGAGNYTADIAVLRWLAPKGPHALDGTCTAVPRVQLTKGGRGWEATVGAKDGKSSATIDETRYLLIHEH